MASALWPMLGDTPVEDPLLSSGLLRNTASHNFGRKIDHVGVSKMTACHDGTIKITITIFIIIIIIIASSSTVAFKVPLGWPRAIRTRSLGIYIKPFGRHQHHPPPPPP
jgi:hypothetical protein